MRWVHRSLRHRGRLGACGRAAKMKESQEWDLPRERHLAQYLDRKPGSLRGNRRSRLRRAHNRLTCAGAKAALPTLLWELDQSKPVGVMDLKEGIEKIVRLDRLGLFQVLGPSFKIKHCLRSADALIEEHWAKVHTWKNPNQGHRDRVEDVLSYQYLSKLGAAVEGAPKMKTGAVRAVRAA